MLLIINRPFINLYLIPRINTEVSTQGMYGEAVTLITEKPNGWCQVQTADKETGWVKRNTLSQTDYQSHIYSVKGLFAHLYRSADTTISPPLMTLPFGAKIKLSETVDPLSRWFPILLVTGKKGWIQRGDIDFSPTPKPFSEIFSLARTFMGIPYTWGGTTSYGFDCSGFIQMLFKKLDYLIPRNARDQVNWEGFYSVEPSSLAPGDILFFGEGKIGHVGLYIGDGQFLHAGVRDGVHAVGISLLKKTNYTFISARRLRISSTLPLF